MNEATERIEGEVIEVLRTACELDADVVINGESRFQEDLGLESVQLLSLAVEVENRFRIMLDEPPDSPPLTVRELAELVAERVAELQAASDG